MQIYYLGKFKILVPEELLALLDKEDEKLVVMDRIELGVYCLISYVEGVLNIQNGWNINYSLEDVTLTLRCKEEEN